MPTFDPLGMSSTAPIEPLSILMVSDFFPPALGGVETHAFELSLALSRRGHKVTVLTTTQVRVHAQGWRQSEASRHSSVVSNFIKTSCARSSKTGHRKGVRWVGAVKVYYVEVVSLASNTSFPTFTLSYVHLTRILQKEGVQVIHGHASTSVLALECLFQGRLKGVGGVLTDHSLFPIGDIATENLSAAQVRRLHRGGVKRGQIASGRNIFSLASHARAYARTHTTNNHAQSVVTYGIHRVGVSSVTCANLLIRCPWHPPALTSRCGNALPPISLPVPPKSSAGGPRLLVLSRLCYRKGTDLLVEILPKILAKHPNLKATIGEKPSTDYYSASHVADTRSPQPGTAPRPSMSWSASKGTGWRAELICLVGWNGRTSLTFLAGEASFSTAGETRVGEPLGQGARGDPFLTM